MKRIPAEKIARIKELSVNGLSKYAIAKTLQISTGAVSYHLKGVIKPDGSELELLRKRNHLLVDLIATYQ